MMTVLVAASVRPRQGLLELRGVQGLIRGISLSVYSRDWRVGVLDELDELRLEPAPGDRRVGQSVGRLVVVQRIASVIRVAHRVEALAAWIIRAGGDQ